MGDIMEISKAIKSLPKLKPMQGCAKCKNQFGVMYICDSCDEEFCKKHINRTSLGELLCDNCFRAHPENPDAERILQKEDYDG